MIVSPAFSVYLKPQRVLSFNQQRNISSSFSVKFFQRTFKNTSWPIFSQKIFETNHQRTIYRYFTNPSEGPSLLELVKILRKETNAGVSDCREALVECHKDLEKAKVWLLKKSKKIAAKKRDRIAQEGGITVALDEKHAVILELNCETDFAAKESYFTSVARNIAAVILQAANSGADTSNILTLSYKSSISGITINTVSDSIEVLAGILKENVKLKRVSVLPSHVSPHSKFKSYIHNPLDTTKPPIGRIGVILQYTTTPPSPQEDPILSKLAHNLCVQIATQPLLHLYPSPEAPPKSSSGDEEGELDVVLMRQENIFGAGTVADVIEEFEKKNNKQLRLEDFRRWCLSEDEEKVEGNLKSDVEEILSKAKNPIG